MQQVKPHAIYRSLLQHLQVIPDPYAWKVLQPYYRSLLSSPRTLNNAPDVDAGNQPESSLAAQLRASRRERHLKRARKVGTLTTVHGYVLVLIASGASKVTRGSGLSSPCTG